MPLLPMTLVCCRGSLVFSPVQPKPFFFPVDPLAPHRCRVGSTCTIWLTQFFSKRRLQDALGRARRLQCVPSFTAGVGLLAGAVGLPGAGAISSLLTTPQAMAGPLNTPVLNKEFTCAGYPASDSTTSLDSCWAAVVAFYNANLSTSISPVATVILPSGLNQTCLEIGRASCRERV